MDPFPSAPITETDRIRWRGPRSRGFVTVVVATAAVLLLTIAPTTAATVDRTWRAKVGTAGANGAITVVAYVSGTGAATLRLKALPRSAMIAVSLRAGTCAKPGSVAAALAATRSSSTGRLNATRALSATAVRRLRAAKSLVATIRSGSFSRCATLARLAVPTPSPSPSDDSGVVEVRAAGFAFSPTALTANAGVPFTVELRNDDAGVRHGFSVGATTTSTPTFTSPIITGTARATFTVPGLPAGTYVFYCPVHPSMKGTLTVRGVGSGATPSPTSSSSGSPAATSSPTSDPTSSPTSAPTASPPGTPEPTPSYYPY